MSDLAAPVSFAQADRPLGQSMRRGTAGRCPACGQGQLFTGYLKVKDSCPSCNEELHHHRADDGPAYVTIFIVSHLAGPLLLAVYIAYRPSTAFLLTLFCAGVTVLSLLLLPRIKGAWVALQWAKRMHGFGDGVEDRPAATDLQP
ncbi:MAG TPA: DUF983 domain-containing protein [Paracoccus sp. (in: a-proteobacteria)]|nr:DUF983 domain-containing protein [Paracoccus sp. (in: a-proteobacteria)]